MALSYDNPPGWIGLAQMLPQFVNGLQDLQKPGVDCVFFGDSIAVVGESTTNRHRDTMVREFMRIMQAELNDSDVPGGLGAFPFSNGGASGSPAGSGGDGSFVTSATPLVYGVGDDGFEQYSATGGFGTRWTSLESAQTRYIATLFDGSPTTGIARRQRQHATSIQVIGRKYSGGPTMAIEAGLGAYVARGGTSTAFSPSGSKSWDMNQATTEYGARSGEIVLASRTNNTRIQYFGGASGSEAFIEGVIAYDGDRDEGFRVHDGCAPGANTSTHWSEGSLQATIDQFCQGYNLARNAHLFIGSFGTNDANDAGTDATDFEASLIAMVERVLDQPTAPSLVLLVPIQYDPAATTHTDQKRLEFAEVIRDVTRQYLGRVACLDLGAALTNGGAWNTEVASRGLLHTDKLHMSGIGHRLAARYLADGLLQAVA